MDDNPYRSPCADRLGTEVAPRPLVQVFALAVGIPLAADFAVLLATGGLARFASLFEQAAPLLIVAWPFTIPVAIWMFYAHKAASAAGSLGSWQLLWLAPLIVIPITTLVWGAVFAHPRGRGFVPWQLAVVHWAFFATIAMGILAVVFNRGRRSFVGSTTVLLLLFSFSCSFTAGSSVTGDWL